MISKGKIICNLDDCPICLDKLDHDNIRLLCCGSKFHKKCIDMVRLKCAQQTCPMCRAQLPDSPEELYNKGRKLFLSIWDNLDNKDSFQLNSDQMSLIENIINIWEDASNQGNSSAQNSLGEIYYIGFGVEKDYDKAVRLTEESAKQGNVYAQYNLGLMYKNVYKDYLKSKELFEKAASQNYLLAQYELGVLYNEGLGVKKNFKKAFEYWTHAAEDGNKKSMLCLGKMYENGNGVEKDFNKAIMWYKKTNGLS